MKPARGTMKIEVQAPRSLARQILTTAIEAGPTYGIGYWAMTEGNEVANNRDEQNNVHRLAFTFKDEYAIRKASGKSSMIDERDIARALGLALTVSDKGEHMKPGWAEAAAQWLGGNGDGPSADVIVQLAVFNDVVYG